MTSASASEQVDCLIDARWVIPVDPDRVVLADHCVAVRDGHIVAVLPSKAAGERFRAVQRFALPDHALIPGLINLHTHAATILLRGIARGHHLTGRQSECVGHADSRQASPGFVHDGTLLACAEMLRSGITCFNDTVLYPEASARAAIASGMRAAIGIIAGDFPTPYAADADDYLAKGLAVRDALRENPLLSFCMAPQTSHAVGNATFARILTMAAETDLPIHLHLHESLDEIAKSVSQFRLRPIERLRSLGILGARLIAAHAVHVSAEELDLLARFGCSVAHCPSSNMKLVRGFAPLAGMISRGINVGLGSGGAPGNDRLDIFQEMRNAALLAGAISGDPESMPAHLALRAATLNAAQALGIELETGSISPGKAADLCAVAFDAPWMTPCSDPISQLVFAADRENVSHVWVAGRLAVEDRRLAGIEMAYLDNLARLWQNNLSV